MYMSCKVVGRHLGRINDVIARAEPDGTRAETRFRLSPKRMCPFKSVGASVQSTVGSRGVRISLSNVGYTTFGGGVRLLATHSIRQFPLHFPRPCVTVCHQVPNELYPLLFSEDLGCSTHWNTGIVGRFITTDCCRQSVLSNVSGRNYNNCQLKTTTCTLNYFT